MYSGRIYAGAQRRQLYIEKKPNKVQQGPILLPHLRTATVCLARYWSTDQEIRGGSGLPGREGMPFRLQPMEGPRRSSECRKLMIRQLMSSAHREDGWPSDHVSPPPRPLPPILIPDLGATTLARALRETLR